MPNSTRALQDQLRTIRLRIVLVVNLAFLVYALATTLLSPVAITPANLLHGPHQTRTFATLVATAGLLALWRWPQAVRLVYAPYLALLLALSLIEVRSLVIRQYAPFHLSLWLSVNMAVLFLVYGSRTGLLLAGGTLGVILLGLLTMLGTPLDGYALADWATTLIVMTVAGTCSYLLVSTIEAYLNANERAAQALSEARVDPVTGLPNRLTSEQQLSAALHTARAQGRPLSVVMVDLDFFKRVNDVYGHRKGDEVLRAVGERLAALLPAGEGNVGRWGGEEFIVLLPGQDEATGARTAERLRTAISAEPISGLDITASLGLATLTPQTPGAEDLVHSADQALYRAKDEGRNRVCCPQLTPQPTPL